MSTLERLWAYALLAGAVAMAAFTVLTWSRGWIKNEDDDEIVYRKDHPRSFAFAQLLQIAGIAILVFVGLRALDGWK
jgi:hypothetical protein